MAVRAQTSARVTATLDLYEITIRLSHVKPPQLVAKGKLLTRDPLVGKFSEVSVEMHHLPPSAATFIADMKTALEAKVKAG